MNKKKLSVVMAGAMLASSVSPVLAATESEVDSSQLGSLVTKVYDKLVGTTYTTKTDANFANASLKGKSVYYVEINDVRQTQFDVKLDEAGKATLKDELQEAFKNLSAGDKVEIYSNGFRTDSNGNVVDCTTTEAVKYTDDDFVEKTANSGEFVNDTTAAIAKDLMVNGSTNIIAKAERVRVKDGVIKVYLNNNSGLNKSKFQDQIGLDVDASGVSNVDVLKITKEAQVLDFTKYIDSKGDVKTITASTKAADIVAFPTKVKAGNVAIAPELEETITITGTTYDYKTEDLYDGLMLTTEGHNLLALIKEIDNDEKANTTVTMKQLNGSTIAKGTETVSLQAVNSEYGFTVEVKDAFGKETVYTVKGAQKNTQILAGWLSSRLAKVDILAGDNRYETAVQIAKEQAQVAGSTGKDSINKIVLVNGNSLVDGLSASSLAASIKGGVSNSAAPILLTEADALPKATKAYLKELMKDEVIGDTAKAEIHLVGGKSVLSKSLVDELEDLGFKVIRHGGDNREETSLKVAEAIDSDLNGNNVFVVGAEGEADAMSIAGVAAENSTPIIVAKKGGITEDALEAVEGANVTVLGGELSLSAEDYEAIKEDANAVRRIAGDNRQATNAAIIKEFYNGATGITAKSVIVAKDGKGNNGQLVDALTAANLAAQKNAPVVLATNSLSAEQIDALNLRAKSSKSLYQVGIGVATSVMETVAGNLGLLNK